MVWVNMLLRNKYVKMASKMAAKIVTQNFDWLFYLSHLLTDLAKIPTKSVK